MQSDLVIGMLWSTERWNLGFLTKAWTAAWFLKVFSERGETIDRNREKTLNN